MWKTSNRTRKYHPCVKMVIMHVQTPSYMLQNWEGNWQCIQVSVTNQITMQFQHISWCDDISQKANLLNWRIFHFIIIAVSNGNFGLACCEITYIFNWISGLQPRFPREIVYLDVFYHLLQFWPSVQKHTQVQSVRAWRSC